MNLQTTLEIYAGGPGSGCNPEVGKCGRPKSAPRILSALDAEAAFRDMLDKARLKKYSQATQDLVMGEFRKLARDGIDERFFKKPFKKIVIDQAALNPNEGGHYNRGELVVRPDQIPWATTHEFAHHIDRAWLRLPFRQIGGRRIDTPASVRTYPGERFEYDKRAMASARLSMLREYDKERTRFDAYAKAKGIQSNPPGWDESPIAWSKATKDGLYGFVLQGPSHYGLSNPKEWFAESFKDYYDNDRAKARLKQVAPKTYDLIDKLMHGQFFHDPDPVKVQKWQEKQARWRAQYQRITDNQKPAVATV